MANEFRIKNALLVEGSTNSQPIVAIRDSSLEITTDASTLLVTAKAIYDFHVANSSGGSYWELDGSTLVPSDPTVDVQLSSIQIDVDAGTVAVIDMDVSSATVGTEQSYAFNLDGSTVAKVWGEADGTGVLQNMGFVVSTYQYMGPPAEDGSWRFYVNSTGDLVFEKRISGTWIEKGRFTE